MSLRNFFVTRDGNESCVGIGADKQTLVREGEKLSLSVESLGGRRYLVRGENGAVWAVDVDAAALETVLQVGTHTTRLHVISEREKLLGSGGAGGGAASGEIAVSMPGKIVKLMVAEGDRVVAGQPVLIAEAMKMENEVKAGCNGVVDAVLVAVGDTVDPGQVLVRMTPEE